MRVCQIDVANFLCFRELKLPIDRSFQLLAGPNNAGKSSVIRLVEAFFSDPPGEQLQALQPENAYFWEAGNRILSSVKLWFSDFSKAERELFGDAVRRDGKAWIALRCTRAGQKSYEASRDLRADDAQALYEAVVADFHFVKIPSVRVASGDGDTSTVDRLLDTVEAILIRSGPTRSTGLQREFAEQANKVETLVQEVLDKSAASIHRELPFHGGEVRFRLPEFRHALRGMLSAAQIESVDGATVPVSERGTGFQSALVLGILRHVAELEAAAGGNVLFAVEEPEAFLHPQTQRAMTSILEGIAADAQVLVTTHSPVVVDSFDLSRIARLPLQLDGTDFAWNPLPMTTKDAGKLSRWCNAANSELVFASAVVFVEGEGDKPVIEDLLSRLCSAPGGYFAQGITVVQAAGLTNTRHLVALAERFGVRSYVLADVDGLHRPGGRALLECLKGRSDPLDGPDRQDLIREADRPVKTYRQALKRQAALNTLLEPHGAFVFASDLEGFLIDGLGSDLVYQSLGPTGEGVMSAAEIAQLQSHADERAALGSRLGSKGWNGSKPSGKLKPHLPKIVLSAFYDEERKLSQEHVALTSWLQAIVAEAGAAPV